MNDFTCENLYLVEFLINDLKLNFNPKRAANLNATVRITFHEQEPPIEMLLDEANEYKVGKSILFAPSCVQSQSLSQTFNICVKFYDNTNDQMIGECHVDAAGCFSDILDDLEDNIKPAISVLQDVFELSDSAGASIGFVDMFVRITCFGKQIISQFQVANDKVFYENMPEKRLNVGEKSKKQPKIAESCCADCLKQETACGNESSYPQFQEIGAQMNGNSLTVRIPKNAANTNPNQTSNNGALNFDIRNEYGDCMANIQGASPNKNAQNGVVQLSDPNKDVFVLRISKKDQADPKKAKLELELRTPKMPERKLPVALETRQVQCVAKELDDAAKMDKKKKKGDKKKKKKKAGKK